MTEALEVANLSYRYPDGAWALRDVSLRLEPGECVGLIGPNGSGKSTLLLHLNGLLPDGGEASGRVTIGGALVEPASFAHIRRSVGLLFQDPDDQLFCPTVFEDVAFGPRQFGPAPAKGGHPTFSGPAALDARALRGLVARALELVGLSGFEARHPGHLSGGEKRLACLAGVLACDPAVLVLDEPTSGLDPRGRRQIKALLARLPATRLIATHDLELVVELCPRVIVLDAGAIVAQGPTQAILSDEPLMLAHGLERPHILQHHHPHGPAAAP